MTAVALEMKAGAQPFEDRSSVAAQISDPKTSAAQYLEETMVAEAFEVPFQSASAYSVAVVVDTSVVEPVEDFRKHLLLEASVRNEPWLWKSVVLHTPNMADKC
jgi:hypothetical protein